MVDQPSLLGSNAVAREVDRRKVGRSGTGSRSRWHVEGSTGAVNSMAGNLTAQVRGIARVVTAVANGDLKKLMLDAKD